MVKQVNISTDSSVDHQVINIPKPDDFSICWKNLTYTVKSKVTPAGSSKRKMRSIFNSLNGFMNSGELTGLLGPSGELVFATYTLSHQFMKTGAGKSTLLECVAGIRKTNRFGEVIFNGNQKVKMAFIPQTDYFFDLLTVKEALLYASKFQNSAILKDQMGDEDPVPSDHENIPTKIIKSKEYHEMVVNSILQQLSLETCSSVRIKKCSGGQIKRLSIAQELVSKPHVLILDEPTSGLDSTSAFQTVQLLHDLSKSSPPVAIMATIHQPSARVFSLFHKIYCLSSIGKCIYEGPPQQLLDHFSRFGLEVPNFSNPADVLIEVASGEYGMEYLRNMAIDHERMSREIILASTVVSLRKSFSSPERDFDEMIITTRFPLIHHMILHLKRSTLMTIRHPLVGIFRIVSHLVVGAFLGLLYYDPLIGKAGGCPPTLGESSDPLKFESLTDRIESEKQAVTNNLGLWFFSLVFIQFGAMLPTVLSFPLEMASFAKERTNGWYGVLSYYLGKTLSDAPFQFLCPLLYLSIIWLMTSQPLEIERFIQVLLVLILLSLVSQSQGVLVGALFMRDLMAAVFVAPITVIPQMLFSGFFITVDAIPSFLMTGVYLSYERYAFEAVVIAIYGGNRCGEDTVALIEEITRRLRIFLTAIFRAGLSAEDDVVDNDVHNITNSMVSGIVKQMSGSIEMVNGQKVSGVLARFKLSDDIFWTHSLILLVFFVVLRLVTFWIIHRKGTFSK